VIMDTTQRTIVVVEDSDEDYYTLRRALDKAGVRNPVVRFSRGDEALRHLGGHDPRDPAFVVLDLNLPGVDGREVLSTLKSDSSLRSIPVVVLTTSDNPRDVDAAYHAGANSFHLKVIDFPEFLETVRTITDYWLDTVLLPTPGGAN